MSKYKVGEELIIVRNPKEENKRLKDMTYLKKDDEYATLSWGIKIVNVEYDKPNVTLTYINALGETEKVFAICKDIANFDEERVLEKALLKAFQNEIMNITVIRNSGAKL